MLPANPTTSPDLEQKAAAADLSGVDAKGSFHGYASLFGIADLAGDMVMRGAFQRSIAARQASGIRMLYQHDPAEPIGIWTEIREDGRGLFVRGRLMLDVARAREVASLMRAGALDGLSIGFKTVRARADRQAGVRRLTEIDLWEISVVTFPMQPDARVSAVKADPQKPSSHLAARMRRAALSLNRRNPK